MPQIAKGGKWIFGWVIVRADHTVAIPPAAAAEYHIKPGDAVILIAGSRTSGGFAVTTQAKITASPIAAGFEKRIVGHTQINDASQLVLPPATAVTPDQRLLVVRGSGLALGFFVRGPVYAAAVDYNAAEQQPPIEVFA